ncbi:Zinc finger MYND domain-containing protein 15 [Mycena sanguinolenta]|uniref:Zinc finger MYND domain-containing protein 15 n=1 Tax=Mycena sanguinolenta TaxID=230812 RepID=A0A8H6Z7C6_9AGAR|nr:Zinc finger MYND domain-containing protein 15 [Mycena sanguinolenta]
MQVVTTEMIERVHTTIIQEWERIKHDESPRFKDLRADPGFARSRCDNCKTDMKDSKVCSACKMIHYCSRQCMKTGWKTHKFSCAALKRDGEQIPKYKEITTQFPWTDVAYNGAGRFTEDFVLARFGVLGWTRKKIGYWAQHSRGGPVPDEVLEAPWHQLTEEEGWRLPREFIPTLALQDSDACRFPPIFETNWTSYYQWRGLPISSPAAMMLHWPLSVYACLKELGLGSEDVIEPRRKLTVFYLGAREEVCFIPVFGELALLFPNTDLDLIMFGEATGSSAQRAKVRGIKKLPRPSAFEYTAPAASGSGTVRVFIDPSPPYYCPSRERSEHPDAIVALNAGLGTYISWQHVILRSFEFDIPFVITDYSQACLVTSEQLMDALHQGLTSTVPEPKNLDDVRVQGVVRKVLKEVQVVNVEKVCAALKKERPSKLNGFMQPGQKAQDWTKLAPGSRNACIQVVNPLRTALE